MQQYLDLCRKALSGLKKENRTGTDHIGYHGDMMKFDLADGFPAVTTKKLTVKSVFGEMLGFMRGLDNAASFRELGCNVWNANANDDPIWLANPHRKGTDDLGRIYGVQARRWLGTDGYPIDQLKSVIDRILARKDDRRLIVTHWNPAELDRMALPPCHMFYQFGIQGGHLNLTLYQRSCDVPLGIPFNIAGYSWLLSVVSQITGLIPGHFTHFLHDIHIYENQVEPLKEQLTRTPHPLPTLSINPDIKTLEDLETWVTPDDFTLDNYQHDPYIAFPFSV